MNRISRTLSSALTIFALFASASYGQTTGSGYSRYGIGDLQYFPNSRAAAMGGTDLATAPMGTPISVIDGINPANWTRITMTRFSASGVYRRLSTEDGSNSGSFGTTVFNGFALAIPASVSNGIVAALTLQPYSSVGYTINTTQTQSGLTYDLGYHGEGGVSRAQIGLSGRLAGNVNLGLSYNYYFGSIRHNITQNITSGSYQNSSSTREVQLKGSGATVGLVWSGLGEVLKVPEKTSLSVGAFVSTAARLSADEERRTGSTASSTSTYDTLIFSTYNLKIPLRYGIGFGYSTERYTVGADLSAQNWSEGAYKGVLTATVRKTYRVSAGGEYTPKREQNMSFLQKLTYRAGTSYNASYYVVNNTPVNEFWITGGVSIPILGETRLDLTGEYGTRGSTDFGMQKDNIFRFSFTIIGGEPWFVRPADEN